MFDPTSDQFTYSDILHRIQLKKTRLNGEDKRRRGAIVHRRDYSEAESERRQQLLAECGGLYDEQLDSEEHVRAFKRRRAGEKRRAGGAKAPRRPDDEDDEEEMKESAEGVVEEQKMASVVKAAEASDGNGSPAISDGSSSGSGSDSD